MGFSRCGVGRSIEDFFNGGDVQGVVEYPVARPKALIEVVDGGGEPFHLALALN